jgi:PKD repeat protein
MKSQGIVIGIVGLMALAAFAGLVTASDNGTTPMADDRYGMIFTTSADGTQICDENDPGMPYGNVTFYRIRTDVARCPEEYAGYVVDAGNGHGYNPAPPGFYYVSANYGAGLTAPWNPADAYWAVVDINPAAYGGHHPTAVANYTGGTTAVWANDFEMFPDAALEQVPPIAVANNAGAAQLTWTDMADANGVVIGYPVYKSVAGGAWTLQTVVAVGTQTWTDGAGSFAATNRYVIGVRYYDNYNIFGRSNIGHCTVAVNIPPVANAGIDQSVNEDVLVTFDGSGSSDPDGSIASYSWTFTDGVLQTLTGVAPTYTFATPGVYTVTLQVTDNEGATDPTPDTMTVTVADNSPIAITDTTVGTVEPGVAFDVTCDAWDFQTIDIADVTLYWMDVDSNTFGPIAASSFAAAGNNQITKADNGDSPMQAGSYSWAIPAQATPGEVRYYFATNDGAGHIGTAPTPANLAVAGQYYSVMVQVAGNNNQPHPLVGRVYDNATGLALNGAIITATWYDSNDLAYFTNWTVSAPDGLGVDGWYQIDIFHNNWTTGDLLWVNATYLVGGVPYFGYNTTLFDSADDFLPDDDKEYINLYIDVVEFFELKWTLGWNIWSIPMIRSENVSLGLTDLPFSWFANEHYLDTYGDIATLVAWDGVIYTTFIFLTDGNGTANDLTVTPDNGYWAYVGESWFTDDADGILVPGQYIWRSMLVRSVAVAAGWNLLGWTSFDSTFTALTMRALFTLPAGTVAQPEIIANWTAADWEAGNTANMQLWEGAKDYTTYVFLGAYGQSTIDRDFPIGPGYGFWVYSETAGTFDYPTV